MACALVFGCSHYSRKCKLVSPCCSKTYTCRLCHDEDQTHTLNRKNIKEIICMICNERQSVRSNCRNCEVRFGKYCCLQCNLFDDEDKQQFHCVDCGFCRVGGEANFFHCDKCNLCLSIGMLGIHRCTENWAHSECPVCLEDMHTSRLPLKIPKCGHLIHNTCAEKLESSGHVNCPVCKQSLI